MNWKRIRHVPWLDTRAKFVAGTPRGGTLLDLGSSDGETLCHIAELRPDLQLRSADKFGHPENYPPHCEFQRVDFDCDKFPWQDASMDSITCMHVVEHLQQLDNLLAETARMLKPGGRAYFETPHEKTVDLPSAKGRFTLNFYDDPTHVRVVKMDDLAARFSRIPGISVVSTGISRQLLFAASYPFFYLLPPSRKRFTAQVHWIGWSACLIVRKQSA